MSLVFLLIGFVALLQLVIYWCDKDDSEENFF